jgi:hypothetical protein
MTAVPAAVGGLFTLMQDSPVLGGTNVQLSYGPWLKRPDANDSVVIGWLSAETATVAWNSSPASLEAGDTTEVFTIQCLILCWRGDFDFITAVARADALLEAVRAVVQADPTLDGSVSYAEVFTMSLVNWQLEKGVEVYIQFGVRVTVF